MKLDGLIPDLQRIGNPLEATMQDDKAKELKKQVRKHKAGKARAAKVGKAESWILKETVEGKDFSHRDYGLLGCGNSKPECLEWSYRASQ